jgi:23S rRNA (cytosine1962-C5)-methyltransferase
MSFLKILATKPGKDYELLDSGAGEKLERFGNVTIARPDPQALWSKNLGEAEWKAAQATFVRQGKSGHWKQEASVPKFWDIELAGLRFSIKLSAFKHTGLFPEQEENWKWIKETIKNELQKNPNREISVINLFGYTGGATLAAAQAGAKVCHVDGSKISINSAKENAKLSGLDSKPIRWILDDAMAFVKREARRGNTYDAIIMDPPVYGHGPKKELWQIEQHLPEFIAECKKILSKKPLFVIMNGYASGYSAVAYKNNLEGLVAGHNGEIEAGELALEEAKSGRLLPAGIFARWKSA